MAPKKYCERVVVEGELAALRAEARSGGKAPRLVVRVANFERAPDGKTVLAAPPRNAAEEQAWVDAYGHPYDGPRLGRRRSARVLDGSHPAGPFTA